MPLPTRRLDPNGYYARLDLDPEASAEAVTAAFRRKALILHPDVPGTGDTDAFVAVRHAYDILSHADRREKYDRTAREAEAKMPGQRFRPNVQAPTDTPEADWIDAAMFEYQPVYKGSDIVRRPRAFRTALFVWLAVGAVLCVGVVETALHLLSPPTVASAGITPNAPPVQPLSPTAQRAVLYGPSPVRLAGVPNFFILPGASPAVLWRQDAEQDGYKPVGQLPPFSSVQALRLIRQSGMVEVRYDEASNVFIDSKRLAPGDTDAARRAYCGYNAGPAPRDGEVLEQRDRGDGTLQIDNNTVQPAVVKLRDKTGAVVLAVFLGPSGQAELTDLPGGTFQAEFAIGELWSRACNTFAAGMRARRLIGTLATTAGLTLALPSGDDPAAVDIPERDFEH